MSQVTCKEAIQNFVKTGDAVMKKSYMELCNEVKNTKHLKEKVCEADLRNGEIHKIWNIE